jgi:hypothetical protein
MTTHDSAKRAARVATLQARRNRLNELGEPRHYWTDHADDTIPRNGGEWNKRRIAARNALNAQLRDLGA